MDIPKTIRILICDDHEISRELVANALHDLGFTNVIACDGVDAAKDQLLERFKSGAPFQIVISDWIMPGSSGVDFLQWVRNHSYFAELPFILVTSQQHSNQVIEGISKGASSYIVKPVDSKSLIHKMGQAWKKHHRI